VREVPPRQDRQGLTPGRQAGGRRPKEDVTDEEVRTSGAHRRRTADRGVPLRTGWWPPRSAR
jgi:hypothetical protein